MKKSPVKKSIAMVIAMAILGSCGEGKGTATFTTWGESYIEDKIPADEKGASGFVDGWTIKYEKFLVAFHGITVADGKEQIAATMVGSKLVDNAKKGKKQLVAFPDLEAKSWDKVSYQIRPATVTSDLLGATEDDRTMMVANGYSVYVQGAATKGDVKKTFHWGFTTATQYKDCQEEADNGRARAGIVVTNGGIDVSELTTHGDHFFYDRLKASPDPAIKTSLRFDEKAAADVDGDGEITILELAAVPIDVRKYDPSGFEAPTLGAFMTALTRTVGHFRGEGECTVAAIR